MTRTSRASDAPSELLGTLEAQLSDLARRRLRRKTMTLDSISGARVRVRGKELVCWCSNDYLGLSTHPRLIRAAAEAAAQWGIGARASRLLAGTTVWHERLEQALAAWFGLPRAIVFSSGYLTNLGTLGALLTADDAVFIDRSVHASLADAARASRARLRVFHHNDAAHTLKLLQKARGARRRVIITEGVFSMDGDLSPMNDLLKAAEEGDGLVYVDDAHGAFVVGSSGRGALDAIPARLRRRLIYMATLGKALGCQGGFIAGPTALIDWLLNKARTFVYSTSLAVPVAAAATEALRVMAEEPQWMQALQANQQELGRRLKAIGLLDAPVGSPIMPVILGDAERALRLSARLWVRGQWCPAIRPPTVPEGSSRLRFSVTALHSAQDIETLASVLKDELAREKQ